ncbi:cytochrome c oxidase assembly protein [Sanguibacter sp. HDW7]|uniref:cytochrome c oxidase assembly protein n=1 Tax=Sanguibacter sp. HDW7 TaxID=2714931 RepID=UPI00140C6542|nr:cytochrome c oxidase assembly protein [Sanguibacter sp. HDW7]QIK84598.1 bifunctional copper resistance protein CopD/cytochrome c oxidase assembly protein [Sanguibacter sp. HDW7]
MTAPSRPLPSVTDDEGHRRYRPAVLVGAVLTAVAAVVLAGLTTGIFDPAVISDPGPLVRWSLPVIGVLRDVATSVTIGALVAVTFLLPSGTDRTRALTVAGIGAGAWTLLVIADVVTTFADVLGTRNGDADFGSQLAEFVLQVPLGRTQLAVALIAAVVTVLALLVRTPTGSAWCLALVVGALSLRSLTGHTAGASGHDLAVSAMMVHLVAAAAWTGGILVLVALRTRGGLRGPALADVVARFSTLAAWCLVLVAYSGVLSAIVRLSSVGDVIGTRYGLLLVAKAVGLGALGALGWAHRRRVVARLALAPLASTAGRLFWRLMAAEALLLGAVAGVAGALASSAPPVPDEPPVTPTPAELVTGDLLPPEPTLVRWLTLVRWEAILGAAIVAGLIVYVRWFLRLRRRGDSWPVGRVVAWCAGMVVMLWVTNGGAAVYGRVLFSGHMVQHMTMAMVAPLLLVLSAPMTLALRALPARNDDSRGPREWLLTIIHSRYGQFFANPLVAAANFAGSMIVFYYTPLFEWALTTHVGHLGMVAHFTLAGYFFANALVGIDPGPQRPGYPLRLLLLLATMAFHAFFGVALMSGTALLVPEWFGLLGRPWGPPALEDQQIGGGVAWGVGEIPTVLLAVVVAVRWARDDERTARRRDRRIAKSGEDAELDAYNAMLANLAEHDEPGKPR